MPLRNGPSNMCSYQRSQSRLDLSALEPSSYSELKLRWRLEGYSPMSVWITTEHYPNVAAYAFHWNKLEQRDLLLVY